ncbi:hypothetical protein SANTM175S_10929 [Streptomyces antimycoticus]
MVDADLDGRLRRVGLTPMPAADAVEALTHALHTAGDAVLADVSWQRFLPVFTASRPAPFFTALAPAAPRAAGPVAPEGTLAQRLAGLDGAARHTELLRTARRASTSRRWPVTSTPPGSTWSARSRNSASTR